MPRPTSLQQDLFCVLLLAVFSLTLWVPVLDAVSLNPDESQYESAASFLVSTRTTAFVSTSLAGTFGVFKLVTLLAGPYPMFVMRALTMVIAFFIAAMLFRIVRFESNRWCGLVAGLVFLHLVVPFEGFAVNREWFCSLFTVGGLSLYATSRRHSRPRTWMLAAGGFLCGMALWFKLQAAFITLIVPAVLVVEAIASRSASRLRDELPWFAAGGIGAAVVFLAPFSVHGTLGRLVTSISSMFRDYVGGNEAVSQPLLLDRFLVDLPHRPLFLIGYVLAAILTVTWIARLIRPGDPGTRPATTATMLLAYLILAMAGVRLGDRFFAHYYQLMLPAVAALTGLAVHFFDRLTRERPGWRIGAVVLTVVLVLERVVALSGDPLWLGRPVWPRTLVTIVFVLAVLGLLAHGLQQPLRRAGFTVGGLIVILTAAMVGEEQLAARPASMSHNPHKYAGLTAYFEREAGPGDRLFVWGWAPEIYSLTRLTAASHVTFCQYVANDFPGASEGRSINETWASILMDELEESRPRFVVDASRASWFETDATAYDLRNFPDFELNALLAASYREVARIDDCAVWERLD